MKLQTEILAKAATQARGLAIDAVHKCSSGHLGLPLGCAEIGAVLYGHALNVNPDLTYFGHIVPCGIVDKTVTSMERELGGHVDMLAVKRDLVQNFELIFDINLHKSK